MFSSTVDLSAFNKDMKNILGYANGFIDGVEKAKPQMIANLGERISEILNEFVDSNARMNPQSLHHIYEWYQTGSPNARLFDIEYKVIGSGLSISSTFSQSTSIKNGSKVPFYDKARIMEDGIPVTITPKTKLVFDVDGKTVFTSNTVTVDNPGGNVSGEYTKLFNMFFESYLKQSFLNDLGVFKVLNTNNDFDKNFSSAKVSGKSLGVTTGYNWIMKVGK